MEAHTFIVAFRVVSTVLAALMVLYSLLAALVWIFGRPPRDLHLDKRLLYGLGAIAVVLIPNMIGVYVWG